MTRRRGKKRHINAQRYPSGQVRRATPMERERDVIAAVQEARQRVFGLSPEQVAILPESTVLGRLCATGEITRRQYDVGSLYLHANREAHRAMQSRGYPAAGDLSRGHGHDGGEGDEPEYIEWVRKALTRSEVLRQALAGCGDRFAPAVVDAVVLHDKDLPFFIGALRVGLNALAQALRLPP